MKNYRVYKHIFPDGKIYIGITKRTITKRRSSGYYHNLRLYRAIQKYGWSNIVTEVLCENLTEEQAKQKEIDLIAKYNACDPMVGYNISIGGESHNGCTFNHTEEAKRKISQHNAKYWLGTQGARFGMTHLSQADVDYIKANYKKYSKDMNLEYFAKKFNVSSTVISKVVNDKYCGDKRDGGDALC